MSYKIFKNVPNIRANLKSTLNIVSPLKCQEQSILVG